MGKNRATCTRLALCAAAALAWALPSGAAELRVAGLGWLDNRVAGQKLGLLLGVRPEGTLDANAIEDAALVLFSLLREQGYLDAALTVEAALADGGSVRHPLDARLEPALPRPLAATAVTLQVAPGRRFTLQEVAFTGLQVMQETEARSFFVGEDTLLLAASARIYSPERLADSADNLEEALRQLGFADAAVTVEAAQVDRATGAVRTRVAVREGPRWEVAAVRFEVEGGVGAPEAIVADRTGLAWNTLWRQDTATAIRRWYFARGHPDVQVKFLANAAPEAGGAVGVTVVAKIAPGPEVRVGEVRFEGNTHTRDATVRRLVRRGPGALLDPVYFNEAHVRIARLGVFRATALHYDPPGEAVRDVVFDLTEGRRHEVNLLAGYGSYERWRGGVEWRHFNLLGRAQTGSLKLVQSVKSSQGDYHYNVPDLFGTRIDGSARLFGQHREEFSFVSEEYGATASLARAVKPLGLVLTTGYTFKRLRNVENARATDVRDPEQTDVASLAFGAVRDRRDDPLRPRKGHRISLQVEAASRHLGGGVDYQQAVLGGSWHTKLGGGRWLHAGVAHGVVMTLGAADDSRLPVNVRFHPGGEGSIRGFKRGEAAPVDAAGLFAGAKSFVQANLELEQALTRKFSAVAFVDGVGTAVVLRDYPFDGKLFSAGLGVRYQTIVGPVRVEYGRNLNPRPGDPRGTLQVSVGFPF